MQRKSLMRNVCAALLVSAVGLGGCGGGGDTTTPDAGGNADAAPTALCGTPATTLPTYPATFDGPVKGPGADFPIVQGQ